MLVFLYCKQNSIDKATTPAIRQKKSTRKKAACRCHISVRHTSEEVKNDIGVGAVIQAGKALRHQRNKKGVNLDSNTIYCMYMAVLTSYNGLEESMVKC